MSLSIPMIEVLTQCTDRNQSTITEPNPESKCYWRDLRPLQALHRRKLVKRIYWDQDAWEGEGAWRFHLTKEALKLRPSLTDPIIVEHLNSRSTAPPDYDYMQQRWPFGSMFAD